MLKNSETYIDMPQWKESDELLSDVSKMTEDDVIEGVPAKSIEDIINEVAEEENLSPEEVRKMVAKFQKELKLENKRKKSATKPKRVKNKNKIQQAKKSKKQNRKR